MASLAALAARGTKEAANIATSSTLAKDSERQLCLLLDEEMHEVVRHVSVTGSNSHRDVGTDISRSIAD